MAFNNDPASQTNQLSISIDLEGDEATFKDSLSQTYKKIANTVNTKEGGLYIQTEKITGAQYFTEDDPQAFRNVYRMTVDFGQLPNAGTLTKAHNIAFNDQYVATRIYGAATNQGTFSYLPIPYASVAALNDQIELFIDATNVNITTGIDRSGFTGIVVIEYFKTNLR